MKMTTKLKTAVNYFFMLEDFFANSVFTKRYSKEQKSTVAKLQSFVVMTALTVLLIKTILSLGSVVLKLFALTWKPLILVIVAATLTTFVSTWLKMKKAGGKEEEE